MKRFLFHLFAVTLAVMAAAFLIPGVHVSSWFAGLFAALSIGLINAFVRPILRFLTFPLTILTLGFFYLVLNGICFALAATLVPGFSVDGFAAAFGGSVVVWAVSTMVASFGDDDRDDDERRG